MKLCKNCGKKIEEEKLICPYCASKLEDQVEITIDAKEENPFGFKKNEYNKWISFFLCLFFGWLGAHKFYEQKYFLGILYLCSFGLFGIGWILDLIILIQKPNPYYLYQ